MSKELLEKSIRKYRDRLKRIEGVDIERLSKEVDSATLKKDGKAWLSFYDKNCPLCSIYLERVDYLTDCIGCPVEHETGYNGCDWTPWEDFSQTDDINQAIKYLHNELDFLVSLRRIYKEGK